MGRKYNDLVNMEMPQFVSNDWWWAFPFRGLLLQMGIDWFSGRKLLDPAFAGELKNPLFGVDFTFSI
jgi:hypothetical protein